MLGWIYEGQPGPPERFQYGVIQFAISNRKIDVSRIYPSVINVFQRIGGVCQIFIFVFVYLMIYSNEVIIELYLLNFGVLMLPIENNEEDAGSPAKLNQVADISQKP